MKKTILAIETSCDETGIALVEASGGLRPPGRAGRTGVPKFKVLENLVSSQIHIHRPFGGVVPGLAKREHIRNLPILFEKLKANFSKSKIKNQKSKPQFKIKNLISSVDLIAVTVGPGLEPALWTGITFAKELAKKYEKPLIGANHLEGHLYSFLLTQKVLNVVNVLDVKKKQLEQAKRSNKRSDRTSDIFPAVCLLVSGGHTILLAMESLANWKKIGETRDDAAGEAFDKVARMLGLSYPGGPEIEKLARKGDAGAIRFPRPMLDQKNYDFSFSGLKTAVFYYLQGQGLGARVKGIGGKEKKLNPIPYTLKADIAASFQRAVTDVLVEKTMRAARAYSARSIILCGGVAANRALRQRLKAICDVSHLTFHVPAMEYNTDNAAMIAAAGYFAYLQKRMLPLRANGDLKM